MSSPREIVRGAQYPLIAGGLLERCAFAESTGLASQNRHIVPGIIDRLTPKTGPMHRNRGPVLLDDDPISIGMDLDRATRGRRQVAQEFLRAARCANEQLDAPKVS
jgi:hypothetical protein